ncbi:MAG: hypothetical protein JJT89_04755 [Nitriliruptoraceae bacterium]|nr:hypothetical protein [Nitriliruptoraceae bacterium]
MALWQILALGVVVLLPFALLVDLHPRRERLTARGAPLQRDWHRQIDATLEDDEHH